jgi:hypothetical protein
MTRQQRIAAVALVVWIISGLALAVHYGMIPTGQHCTDDGGVYGPRSCYWQYGPHD